MKRYPDDDPALRWGETDAEWCERMTRLLDVRAGEPLDTPISARSQLRPRRMEPVDSKLLQLSAYRHYRRCQARRRRVQLHGAVILPFAVRQEDAVRQAFEQTRPR